MVPPRCGRPSASRQPSLPNISWMPPLAQPEQAAWLRGCPQSSPHEAQPKELSKGALTPQPGFPNWCQGTLGYLSKLTGVLWDISIILRENTAILDILQTQTKLPAQSRSQFDP